MPLEFTSLTAGTNEDARFIITVGSVSGNDRQWLDLTSNPQIGSLTGDNDIPPAIGRVRWDHPRNWMILNRESGETASLFDYIDNNRTKSFFVLSTRDLQDMHEIPLADFLHRGGDNWTRIETSDSDLITLFDDIEVDDRILFVLADANSVSLSTAPDAPQNLSLTAGDQQIDYQFDDPTNDGGSPILDYRIRYSTDESTWTTITDADRTGTITSLTNGTQYYVQAAARNVIGIGDYTTSQTATPTASSTAPDAPQNLSLTAGDQQIDYQFDDPTNDGGSPILDYRIRYSTDESTWTTITDADRTGTITSLTNGTQYYVQAAARNVIGIGDYTTSQTATPTASSTAPDAPQNLSLTAGDQQIDYQFDDPTNDGGSPILDYRIRYSTDESTWTTITDADRTGTIANLTNGTQYYVQAAARNVIGIGDYTTSQTATPTSSNTVPHAVDTPSLSVGDTELDASWSEPNDGGSAITGYDLRHSTDESAWTEIDVGNVLTYNIQSLTNGTLYYVQVRARNTIGDGAWSASARATPVEPGSAIAVSNIYPPTGQPSVWATIHKNDAHLTGLGFIRLAECTIERNVNRAIAINAATVASDRDAKRLLRYGNYIRIHSDLHPQNTLIAEGFITRTHYTRDQANADRTFEANGLLKELSWRTIFPGRAINNQPLIDVIRDVLLENANQWVVNIIGIGQEVRISREISLGSSVLEFIESVADIYNYHFFAKGRVLFFGDFSQSASILFKQTASGSPFALNLNEVQIESIEIEQESYDLVNRVIPYSGPPEFPLTLENADILGRYLIHKDGEKYFIQDDTSISLYGLVERTVAPPYLIYPQGRERLVAGNLLYDWAISYLEENSKPQQAIRVESISTNQANQNILGKCAFLIYKPLSATDNQPISQDYFITGITEQFSVNGYRVQYDLNSRRREERSMIRALADNLRNQEIEYSGLEVVAITGSRNFIFNPLETVTPAIDDDQLDAPILKSGNVWGDDTILILAWDEVRNATNGYEVEYWASGEDPIIVSTQENKDVRISPVNNDKTYYVQVRSRATSEFSASEWSETHTARPYAPPSEPVPLATPLLTEQNITARDREIEVNIPSVEDARTYEIEYDVVDDLGSTQPIIIQGLPAGKHIIEGLENGVLYRIRVHAEPYWSVNEIRYFYESDWSMPIEVTPQPEALELTLPENVRDIVEVRVTMLRDNLRPHSVELVVDDTGLDIPLFFPNQRYQKSSYDLRDSLEPFLVNGVTNRYSIRLSQGRNGVAFYTESENSIKKPFQIQLNVEIVVAQSISSRIESTLGVILDE